MLKRLPKFVPMKAQELRIGNYVNRLGEKTEVTAISIGHISTPASGAITLNQIKPIPLTEEWLIKFGFEKDTGNDFYDFWNLKDFRVFVHKNAASVFIHWKGNELEPYINNLHVQQLQNLFFALTGEELTTKAL